MTLGALIDAGLSLEALKQELAKIPVSGYEISARKVVKSGLAATQVNVEVSSKTHRSRTFAQIRGTIEKSKLSPETKDRGLAIFSNLAKAEGKVHGAPAHEVRLHEVGAVDAIVDIMGAVIGFRLLGIEKLYASPLPSGQGTITTDHGFLYPVPAPATMELLAAAQAPLKVTGDPWLGEMVTPTGAAIVTTLATFQRPVLALEAVGCGCGSRDLARIPNILRLWIGTEMEAEPGLTLLETNIDDMSPQIAGYVMERLFELGAKDVWFTAIQMKKDRPATMLSVLAPAEKEHILTGVLLRETTTLGVRSRPVARHEAEREFIQFESSLGKVNLKIKRLRDEVLGFSPEYEDCRKLAAEKGLPLQEVFRTVEAEARQILLPKNP